MRTLLLALCVTLPLAASADIVPPDVYACHDKTAGAACTTEDGKPGTCRGVTVTRPDYSTGIPPKYKQVQMLRCEATASSSARVADVAWLPWGLAALAGGLGALTVGLVRRRRLSTP